jgi:hypothetical protein
MKYANCGKKVTNEDLVLCPNCAKPIKALRKRTLFPKTAGILTITGSVLAIAISMLYLSAASISLGYRPGYINGLNEYYLYYLATGIFGTISFPFGLTSGIFALKHKRLAFSIFGLSLLITCGVMMSIPLFIFGLPILVLSILSIIFVVISKTEFN